MQAKHTDNKDIQRGAIVNFLGYGLKLATPVLLIAVANRYGAEVLGDFIAIQALILLVSRFILLGLDKAVLWWVAKSETLESSTEQWRPFWNSVRCSLVFSIIATIILYFGAEKFLEINKQSGSLSEVLRIMAFSLIPASLTDLVLHSLMGKKKMGPQVFIKETFVPVSMVAFAILIFAFTPQNTGLAWGFLVSQWLGLFVSLYFLKTSTDVDLFDFFIRTFKLDKAIINYSIPLWISEVGNSFLQRMDIFAITYFVKSGVIPYAGAIGVYGIVAQFANAVRSIRRSFDPILLSVVSSISADKDKVRLEESFNHASYLITLTQLPIFVFFFCFAEVLLSFYGAEFTQGTTSIWILSGFWLLNGSLGLCGVVLLGYGYSYFSLINVIIAIMIKAVLLYFIVPIWGMEGTAFSVGLAYFAQGIIQWLQARIKTGTWLFKVTSFMPYISAVLGLVVAYLVFKLIEQFNLNINYKGISLELLLSFVGFLIVYIGLNFQEHQKAKAKLKK